MSNPSFFVKNMQEGNALGPSTGSYPRGLVFGAPVSYARPTEARRDLKNGTGRLEPGKYPRGKKSLAERRPIFTTDPRRHRPRLEPRDNKGRVNIKTQTLPRDTCSP
jgi:hypothetical protein